MVTDRVPDFLFGVESRMSVPPLGLLRFCLPDRFAGFVVIPVSDDVRFTSSRLVVGCEDVCGIMPESVTGVVERGFSNAGGLASEGGDLATGGVFFLDMEADAGMFLVVGAAGVAS